MAVASAHSFVMVSSRFNKTRETAVQAASWAGVASFGSSGLWPGSSAASAQGSAPGFSNRRTCLCSRSSSVADSASVGLRDRQRRKAYSSRSAVVAAAFADRPQRQGPGAFQEDRLVERGQRLERRVGARPPDAGEIAVGGVERLEHRIGHRAIAERVQRPAVAVGSLRLVPDLGPVAGRRLEQEGRGRRERAGAADLRLEQPAGGQGDVADDLGIHPEPRAAGQQPVVRVAGRQRGRHPRRLAIGRRGRRSAGAAP